MVRSNILAIIPVKSFGEAKRRLAPLLSAAERAELGRVMLEDVLGAVTAANEFSASLVVTSDAEAKTIAEQFGAHVIDEGRPAGINAAVTLAAGHLRSKAADGLVVVPADIPHLSARTLDRCLGHLSSPRSAVLVPAAADGGTNLLGLRPSDVIAPSFGLDSFARHRVAARAAGVEPAVLTGSEAERDIDRPEDVAYFVALGTATRTQAFLAGIDIDARLAACFVSQDTVPQALESWS